MVEPSVKSTDDHDRHCHVELNNVLVQSQANRGVLLQMYTMSKQVAQRNLTLSLLAQHALPER